MRRADFIPQNRAPIPAEWKAFARTRAPGRGAIPERIVNARGGRIDVDSPEAGGTTFPSTCRGTDDQAATGMPRSRERASPGRNAVGRPSS